MKLATQLSALPTNKLLAGTGVNVIAATAWAEVMTTIAPSLAGPGMSALIGAAIGLLAGYFVPDRVNAPRN
ncbi:hypothetical protein [Falsirhodobacter halotolerans]|uniref:hypothetical protein n=1 Tax=Falsirhodobacter halotolerans TaxID=1146892 RepID=UPI001FD590F9|nr:hypothetical protein [Falsirhodobacter halotolerans]MCJ8139410.1 hypothetical protein [Falsirhodobacter halotolerans]